MDAGGYSTCWVVVDVEQISTLHERDCTATLDPDITLFTPTQRLRTGAPQYLRTMRS